MKDTQWIFNIINLPQIDKFASPTCVYPYPDLCMCMGMGMGMCLCMRLPIPV